MVARISPIPNVDEPHSNDDHRRISILPALSKIYEKLTLRQMADFAMDNAVFHPNISAYRKCHSATTTTCMLAIRDRQHIKSYEKGRSHHCRYGRFFKGLRHRGL